MSNYIAKFSEVLTNIDVHLAHGNFKDAFEHIITVTNFLIKNVPTTRSEKKSFRLIREELISRYKNLIISINHRNNRTRVDIYK